MIRVLDLFSGIGGFSLGLKKAGGFRTVCYVEIEAYCQEVLLHRMEEGRLDTAPIFENVLGFYGTPWRGSVDLIVGGFPCQDLSHAGKRAGIEGSRSGLWSEFARLIREIRPKLVLVENVAAILNGGADRVLGDLAELGYDAEWDCIRAAACGAPHLRDRFWLVAYPSTHNGSHRGIFTEDGQDHSGWWEKAEEWGIHRNVPQLGTPFAKGLGTRWTEVDTDPVLPRMAHGIPDELDRIGALGNAVVPQVVEWIARRIKEVAR